MKRSAALRALVFTLLGFTTIQTFAWNHSIEIGYGRSHDPNNSRYTLSGGLLTGDFYAIKRTKCTFWSLNGALGQWYASTPVNKNLTTAAISLALRLYPFTNETQYPTYLLGSVGPAYISSQKFSYNTQASHATFQWNLGVGAEFKKIDVNFRAVHFSNAHLASPDQGFTILYMLSIGYLF